MRKYFDTIIDPRGEPVEKAEIRVTDGFGGAVQLYSDNAGAALAQPVLTTKLGYFEFFVADGTYSLDIRYTGAATRVISSVEIYDDDSQLTTINRLVTDVDALKAMYPPLAGAMAVIIANRPAMAAIVGMDPDTPVFLTELEHEGNFVWRLGDYSAEVAADPDQNFYVEADAVGADTGAWVRSSDSVQHLSSSSGASLIGTASGDTVQEALDGLDASMDDLSGDLSAVASFGASYNGVDPLAVVASDSTANIANPDAADVGATSDTAPAIGTTTANQLHRLRSNGTGLLSAQNSGTQGTFAVTRKYDVVASKTYTFHMHECIEGWLIYSAQLGFIQFFNADGSFHSEITSGFITANPWRFVTFIVPVGAAKVAFNIRNAPAFSNTNPMTEQALQSAIENVMLCEGSVALPFTPFTTTAYLPAVSRFSATDAGAIRLTRSGSHIYVRTAAQQHPTKDLIWQLIYGQQPSYHRVSSRSGVIDIYGQRFADKTATATISAFNQTLDIQTVGTDESCPERRNGTFVDGGHGSPIYEVTKAAHGMTNVDVGSIWSDGTDQWLLFFILATNTLVFQRRYTVSDTKWNIASAGPASSTFTHVSGATHTGSIAFTGPTQSQFVPIIRDYTSRIVVGDTVISTITGGVETAEGDGDFSGDTCWLEELYLGLNLAKVQDSLIANVGAASPNWTPDVAQVRRYNRYEFNRYGAMTVYCAHFTVDAFRRSVDIDYFGGIQLQRLALPGDSSVGMQDTTKLYIPDVGTVGGYNFKAIADLTGLAVQIDIHATDCDDPSNPSSQFCLLGDKAGVRASGQAFGYDPGVGLGVPAIRAAKANRVFSVSASKKNYPIAIDSKAGDAAAGDTFELAAYRAPFLPTDPDLTIPGVIYHVDGKPRCIVAAHKALSRKHVTIPHEFTGLAVTILAGAGLAADGFVRDGKITIDVPSGHGMAVLGLG